MGWKVKVLNIERNVRLNDGLVMLTTFVCDDLG
jgi:hypothetical protein